MALAILGCASFYYIAHRPRTLNDERRHRLEEWVREADRDRVVTPEEQSRLDQMMRGERLQPDQARDFVAQIRQQIEESRQSVRQGHQLVAKGQLREARQAYQQAAEKDPANATAWANLGLALATSGQEQAALDAYAKALQLEPNNWAAHYNLGLLWARRNDPEKALHHLEKAFEALPDPASPEAQAMVDDLKTTTIPATLRRESRFSALLDRAAKR